MIAWLVSGLLQGGAVLGAGSGPVAGDGSTLRHPMTESVVIKAAEVHVGDGKVYRPGTIILLDSEIVAVGTDPGLPLSPRIIDLGEAVVTPGMIDAACQLGPRTGAGTSAGSYMS